MSKQLGNLMRQAQKMQEKMAEMQKELASRTVDSSAGGGMVTAVVNGSQELVGLKIDPSVVDPKDIDMLQDLVVAAVSEGLRKSKQMVQDEMSKLTSGMGLNLPGGLF
ncbi:MAG TPA: YbaB/EbfC family nucleoid-associated protein [Deltaproteobacteria bacterium]|nr:MAG: nucleoid-associated protein, YbaB/EbfC family [Deltaproteobacteria bacterium GWA2_55_82]OGQ64996.1 MAG: nucleoid-associated protein, YbaB/EbfC family [Deltaproteobacteria bacterium RIFCSPLOWO2_02_FULL_55_12]OIJ73820.1 MAG: nucleoid-associated protein, YbaB/EbfC family [Deltaproteobacteria bacterium GWC2_55_46]HBG45774.1 YbaB/EbfC family nucleoid-associated protein [Deltaproteobacteria bacterium]HCY09807.1 YbaB/EbfC family nucleoid-associated protein [Deltaproteobacteria bacterium]